MRKSVSLILGELNSKTGGYASLLFFRYLNLCVQAEAASLLPVTVEIDDTKYDIEKVADIAMTDTYSMTVYPKGGGLLYDIGKAIAMSHPEFKQDIMVVLEDGEEVPEDKMPNATDDEKCILLTMPTVDKGRRDTLLQGAEGLYKQATTAMDREKTYASLQLAEVLLGAPQDEIKEAKDSLEEISKQAKDKAKEFYEGKKKEIENAYNEYLEKEAQHKVQQQQDDNATNSKVAKSMKLPDAPEAPKAPEMPKAPDMKMPEMPKAPDMKMPEMPKAPDMKMPEMPK